MDRLFFCKSSHHWWTTKEDADKCCNGWHRELRVVADDQDRLHYSHVWVKDDDLPSMDLRKL